ncbi:MAG: hypothetical protein K0R39_3296 [Symbiobacteriaceae bacterium]|jgi:hypothetical protein|nr:hypothetical protein [Symbiobacteriaceae bacterium]
MHLSLTATNMGHELWKVTADGTGAWTYESRSVEQAEGRLTEGDRAQLIGLYEHVDWNREVLNHGITSDTMIRLHLDVTKADGDKRTYTFNADTNQLSTELADLVHFLRHNIMGAGEPVGRIPDDMRDQPRL